MNTFAEIQSIFRRVLNSPNLALRPEATAWEVEGWDSLAHMQLLLEIEQHFDIAFSAQESLALECIGDLHKLVEQKLREKSHARPT